MYIIVDKTLTTLVSKKVKLLVILPCFMQNVYGHRGLQQQRYVCQAVHLSVLNSALAVNLGHARPRGGETRGVKREFVNIL